MLGTLELNAGRVSPFLVSCSCVALVLLGFVSLQAQSGGGVDQTGTGGRHTIQGRIYFPSGQRSDVRVQVKLESYIAGELSVLSDSNGSFRFSGLSPGTYTVFVDAGDQYEIARETVFIDTDGSNIRLPPISRLYTVQISLRPKASDTTKSGVVNAALAGVPAAARDLYQKALALTRTGDHKKAIEDLQNALAVYPDFPLALNELGVQFLRLGQADKAAQALARAVKLAPEDFMPRLNYGVALLNQKKFAQAEEQLRVAVKKKSSVAMPHLYLGMTLAMQRKLDEAEKELRAAIDINGNETGPAHKYLGGIYIERREYKRAADELDTYLSLVPTAADAALTRQKIRELLSKSRSYYRHVRSTWKERLSLCVVSPCT